MKLTNPGEIQFYTEFLKTGKSLIIHPLVRLKRRYFPDFYCPEENIYYEIISTRQAYHIRKDEMKKASKAGLNIKIIWNCKSMSTNLAKEIEGITHGMVTRMELLYPKE